MDKLLEHIYGMTDADIEDCSRYVMLGGGTRGGPVLVRGDGVRLFDRAGSHLEMMRILWDLFKPE